MSFTPSPTGSVVDGLLALMGDQTAFKKKLAEFKAAETAAHDAEKKASEAQGELISQREDVDKKQKGLDERADFLDKKEKSVHDRENKVRAMEQETKNLHEEAQAKMILVQQDAAMETRSLKNASLIEDGNIAKQKELEQRESKIKEREAVIEAKLAELASTRDQILKIASSG